MNFDHLMMYMDDLDEQDNYSVTGSSPCIISNRISYVFNLLGPSMTIDTACSSSLVAIHLACQSLITGDADMAISGGVSVMLAPGTFVQLSRARMSSPSGQSHAFSELADGYARGEGCGIIILKKYGQARRDGDNIWGVIATGSNQDGQTVKPISSPSQCQQEALMKHVYSKFKVQPSSIQYIEAHGTGTPTGDPIEAKALGNVIGKSHTNGPCLMGSVKTNVGHTESAAGVAGLIKILLMMQHETIVPSLHSERLNPNINFDELKLRVVKQEMSWKCDSTGRFWACANSFGVGGTNAHIIVCRKCVTQPKPTRMAMPFYPVLLSASTPKSLNMALSHLASNLENTSQTLALKDLSFTALCRRSHLQYRVFIVSPSIDDLIRRIKNIDSQKVMPVPKKNKRRLIFIFGGMGSLWDNMGLEMIRGFPFIKTKVQEIHEEFRRISPDISVMELLERSNVATLTTEQSQAVLFTMQMALYHSLTLFGIQPDVVLGHSIGEVAAAHASGALVLSEAVKVVHHRSKCLGKVHGGKMLAVNRLPVEESQKLCQMFPGKVEVAAINSAMAFTLSGDERPIKDLRSHLKRKSGVQCSVLNVNTAFHSHHVEPIVSALKGALTDIKGLRPRITTYSTVTGKVVSGGDFITAEYWARNVRNPVRFSQTVESVLKDGDSLENIVVEISPRPVLKVYLHDIHQSINDSKMTYTECMSNKEPTKQFITALSRLHCSGILVDWKLFFGKHQYTVTSIPQYQLHRQPCLFIPDHYKQRLNSGGIETRVHPLITKSYHSPAVTGTRVSLAKPQTYKVVITQSTTPYVYDHIFQNNVVLMGSLYSELGFAGFISTRRNGTPLTNAELSVEFVSKFNVNPVGKSEVNLSLTEHEENTEYFTQFIVHTTDRLLAKGTVRIVAGTCNDQGDTDDFANISETLVRCPNVMGKKEFYSMYEDLGYKYGPLLQGIQSCNYKKDECLAQVDIPDSILEASTQYCIHPAVLDLILQCSGVIYQFENDFPAGDKVLPQGIQKVRVLSTPRKKMLLYMRGRKAGDRYIANGALLDNTGRVIIECRGLVLVSVGASSTNISRFTYDLTWRKILKPGEEDTLDFQARIPSLERGILFADTNGWTEKIASHILPQSASVTKMRPSILSDSLYWESAVAECCKQDFVFYGFGCECRNVSYLDDELAQYIELECMFLQQLVSRMIEKKCKVPIYVFTCNAFSRSYQQTTVKSISLTGSPLWGFIRTYLCEPAIDGFQSVVKLVDFDAISDSTMSLAKSILSEEMSQLSEMAIDDSGLFIPVLTQAPMKGYTTNATFEQTPDRFTEYDISSSCVEAYSGIHLVPSVKPKNVGENSVSIKVKSFDVHRQSMISPTVTSKEIGHLPWDNVNSSHQVISLHLTGAIQSGCSEQFYAGQEVSICGPVPVASSINVRESSLLEHTSTTFDLPCAIIAYSILNSLKDCISHNQIQLKKSAVLLIVGEYTKELGNIVSSMNGDIIVMDADSLDSLNGTKVGSCILTTTLTAEQLSSLRPHISNHLKLTVVSDWVDKRCMHTLLSQCQSDCLHFVELDHVFHPSSIGGILSSEAFKKWIPSVGESIRLNHPTRIEVNPDYWLMHRIHVQSPQMFWQNGMYIVVGGLTGLGELLVSHLSENGAGFIGIISRSSPSPEQKAKHEEVESCNHVRIISFSADISSYQSLADAFKQIELTIPQNVCIKGVFHGAAVFADIAFQSMTRERMNKVLAPKIKGTINLHTLTTKYPLDYFVMHSSIASVIGNAGQSNYAAANAFQNSFAHYRQSHGLPAQAINWSAMRLGEIERQEKLEGKLNRQGICLLEKHEVIECFKYALLANPVEVIFSKFDLQALVQFRGERAIQPMYDKFTQIFSEAFVGLTQEVVEGSRLKYQLELESILKLTDNDQMINLKALTKKVISDIFPEDASSIPDDVTLFELGFDSMQRMNLASKFQEVFNLTLSDLDMGDLSESTVNLLTERILKTRNQ